MKRALKKDKADDSKMQQRKRRFSPSMRNLFKRDRSNSKRQQKGTFSFRRQKKAPNSTPDTTIYRLGAVPLDDASLLSSSTPVTTISLSDESAVPGSVPSDDISLLSFMSDEKISVEGNGSYGSSKSLSNKWQQEVNYDDYSIGKASYDPTLAEVAKTLDYKWAEEETKNMRRQELSISKNYLSEVPNAEYSQVESKRSNMNVNILKLAIITIITTFLSLIVDTIPQLSFLSDRMQEETNDVSKQMQTKIDEEAANFTWDMVFTLEG